MVRWLVQAAAGLPQPPLGGEAGERGAPGLAVRHLADRVHTQQGADIYIPPHIYISADITYLLISIYLSIPDVAGLDPLRVPRGRVLAAAVPGVYPRHGHAHHGQVYLLYTRVYIISKHIYT